MKSVMVNMPTNCCRELSHNGAALTPAKYPRALFDRRDYLVESLVISTQNSKSLTVIDEGEKGLLNEEMRIEDDQLGAGRY